MLIYAIMQVCGRPTYTQITLGSLGRSDAAQAMLLNVMLVEKDGLDRAAVTDMVERAGLRLGEIWDGPNNSAVGIQQSFYKFAENAHRHDIGYMLFLENDVLYNPDWFVRTTEMFALADADGSVGLASPLTVCASWCRAEPMNGYLFRPKGMPSQCYLVHPYVPAQLPLNSLPWDQRPTGGDKYLSRIVIGQGLRCVSLAKSEAMHIGKWGLCFAGNYGSGSLGFEPDTRVLDLYERAINAEREW